MSTVTFFYYARLSSRFILSVHLLSLHLLDPDVKALLRIAVVYDIPIANNLATADFMLHSKNMNESYSRQIENFDKKASD